MKVFLGGTVNNSTWRDEIIPRLNVDYFNPVVEEWTEDAQAQELFEREHCDYCLYVITPKMTGYYSIAEIIDDSYKRPDRTIFSYLKQDQEFKFDENKISELEKVKKIVENNGGLYLSSLEEVIKFLNSANSLDKSIINEEIKDVFISYGRRHSLDFAKKLYKNLSDDGYKIWFDMNNIPLGVDFQEQIDQGIQKADNFIYVMSPHSVKSEYCLKELILALKYNKRIIPILHIEPSDCWDKIHHEIGKRNWIYMRENADENIQREKWEQIDDFQNAYIGLEELLELHKDYVRKHTILLNFAINWHQNQRKTNLLVVGNERKEAEEWLLKKKFKNNKGEITQQPCLPTNLHAEYICEAKKNANNLQTDTFLSYSVENKKAKDKIYKSLIKNGITVWLHTKDIEKGEDYEHAINRGIEQADNFIYFISNEAIESKYCNIELEYAFNLNKRIIPILIEKVSEEKLPSFVQKLQYVDFSECINEQVAIIDKPLNLSTEERVKIDVETRREKSEFELKFDQLLYEIQEDADYYQKHKVFLVQAIRWEKQNKNQSVLLRGYNLENAKTWLKLAEKKIHKPLKLHKDFIEESEVKSSSLDTEVFISYSRTDADFARKLNVELQLAGKTTWFDQESIASSADFQQEIYKGIEISNNFVFIISPDSVNSPFCKDEVEFANKLNKRIITILCRDTETSQIPQILSVVQWIDFEKKNFNISFHELIRTLDTDREHVQKHTKYSQLSLEWLKKEKDEDLLLRGSEFTIAENWMKLAIKENKKPRPTQTQIEFLSESKQNIEKQAKTAKSVQAIIKILFFVSVIGLGVALYFMIKSRKAMNEAREKEKSIQSLYLASIAKDIMETESVKALQLVYEAYQSNHDNTHPFIIKAFTDVFNNFITGKKAYFVDEIYLSDGIYSAKYTENGDKLFAYSSDSIKTWKQDGSVISQFADNYNFAEITEKGDKIITFGDKTLKIFNLNGQLVDSIYFKDSYILDFYVDDDKILIIDENYCFKTFDLSANLISKFTLQNHEIFYNNYINKQDRIITLSMDSVLNIWTLDGDTILNIENYIMNFPIFDNNNDIVLCITEADTISIFDLNGKLIKSLKKKFVPKFALLSPEGKNILIQKADNNLNLIDLTGKIISTFNMQDDIFDAKFNNTGNKIIVLNSYNDIFYLWDLELKEIIHFEGHDDNVTFADFIPNTDLIISYSTDKTAKIWNLNGEIQMSLEGHSEEIIGHSISSDGKLLTYSYDGNAKIWDITKVQKEKFKGHNALITNLKSSNNGNFIYTIADDKTLKIWDKEGRIVNNYETDDYFDDLVISSNSNIFASFDSEKVIIYNIADSSFFEIKFADFHVDILTFSSDASNYLVVDTLKSFVRIYDSNNNIVSETLDLEHKIREIIFVNTNQIYFLTDENLVILCDKDFNFYDFYETLESEIFDINFYESELYILTRIFKTNNLILDKLGVNKPIIIRGTKEELTTFGFTDNGKYILTNSKDNVLKYFDLNGKLVSTFYENIEDISEIKYSKFDDYAIIFYYDNTGKIINIADNYTLAELEHKISTGDFSNNGLIYYAKDNKIETIYTISAAIEWMKQNEIPPLTDRDKEKYGIISKSNQNE